MSKTRTFTCLTICLLRTKFKIYLKFSCISIKRRFYILLYIYFKLLRISEMKKISCEQSRMFNHFLHISSNSYKHMTHVSLEFVFDSMQGCANYAYSLLQIPLESNCCFLSLPFKFISILSYFYVHLSRHLKRLLLLLLGIEFSRVVLATIY